MFVCGVPTVFGLSNMTSAPLDITVIILTSNEEIHIERCVRAVQPIAKYVFVVDSNSTDRTIEIAESLGAKIYQHKFVNHAKQIQWALDTLPIETEWVMRLDADEYPLPELVEELRSCLQSLPADIEGINLKRRHIFWGRWIKHGARYPLVLLRLWRTGKGRIEQRWMDEHIVLTEGRSITFKHDFCDHNLNNISWLTDKHNRYATREAIDVLNRKYNLFPIDDAVASGGGPSQVVLKRFAKEHIYNALPTFSGPLLYFMYRYFIRLGFLDGKAGLVYHFLQGFWYRFLVEVKVTELDGELRKIDIPELKLEKLEELTGCSLR